MDLKAILIGGIAPAILLGCATVLMKLSLKNGASLPFYIMIVGGTVLLFGVTATFWTGMKEITVTGAAYAVAMGVTWAAASYSMSYGISELKLPVSIIAPLSNSNALVAVAISLVIFSEWKDLNLWKALSGTALIVAGATLVSMAVEKSG